MPPKADRPLRKVTLNLNEEDCVKLERWYGHGWSGEVRTRIADFVRNRERLQEHVEPIDEPKYGAME